MAVIIGDAKKNKLIGTNAADTIKGLDGNDNLLGRGGIDKMYGGDGNDTMDGGAGNDKMFGGSGNDKMDGGTGNDSLKGEAGNDTFIHSLGGDAYNGGSGTDTVNYSNVTGGAGVAIDLGTGATFFGGGAAAGDAFVSIERIIGTQFIDLLQGSSGAETLIGGIENDSLWGGGGADALMGGADDDYLFGGLGVDTLTGNSGQDQFDYDAFAESGIGAELRDIITDFLKGDDIINLATIDASTSAGDQAFVFIGIGAFDSNNPQVRFDQVGGNTIIQLDFEGDMNVLPDMEIELTGLYSLTAADFVL